MLLNARQIEWSKGKNSIILLAIEDIIKRKEVEVGLEATRIALANSNTNVCHSIYIAKC